MILTSDNRQLYNGNSIYLTDLSIGLSATKTLFIVVDQPLNSFSANMIDADVFSIFKVDNGIVDVVDKVTLGDIDVHQTNGRYVYVLNVMAFSDIEGGYQDEVSLTIDGTTTNIKLKVDIVGLDVKLAIALQNIKTFITDDWMKAMYDTEIDSKSIDFVLYNEKLREYLLNVMDLDILKGTYRGLESALNFFGFGDLLDIKEHWINKEDGDYKYTSIRNAILHNVDKKLTGYKKTNQMSLVYQINTEDGLDDDSLPIYINVLEDTDKILAKLWVLERILKKEFLYINTHIVDVIGEFQAVVGLEFGFLVNVAQISDVNLNQDSFGKIEKIGSSPKTQTIKNHNLILFKSFIVDGVDDELKIVDGVLDNSTINQPNFYEVAEIINGDSTDVEEFDILTKFHNTDCTTLFVDVNLVENTYQTFKYFIFDSQGFVVFTSEMRGVNTIRDSRITCAVKTLGMYRMVCYFFDYNGGVSIVSTESEVLPVDPKISLGVYGVGGELVDIEHWSTFDTFEEGLKSPVAQNLDARLNINSWDSVDNVPQQIVARYYANMFDQVSTWTAINELNSIPISQYAHLPVNIHGYSYATLILDVVPNHGYNTVGLAYFKHDDFDSASLYWDGIESMSQWLSRFAGLLNTQTNKLSDFTWSLHSYSNNPLATLEDAHYVIVGKSKVQSLMSTNIRVQNTGQLRADYQENYFKDDVRAWSVVDSVTRFGFSPSGGELTLRIGDKEEVTQHIDFMDMDSLKVVLNDFVSDIDGVWIIYNDEDILIYSDKDIYFKHNAIGGVQKDIVRAVDSNSIISVPRGVQITVGEPIFAHIKKETLQDVYDPKWALYRENDGVLITEQNSIWFRSVVTKKGTYTLRFQYKNPFGESKEFVYGGCFIVA